MTTFQQASHDCNEFFTQISRSQVHYCFWINVWTTSHSIFANKAFPNLPLPYPWSSNTDKHCSCATILLNSLPNVLSASRLPTLWVAAVGFRSFLPCGISRTKPPQNSCLPCLSKYKSPTDYVTIENNRSVLSTSPFLLRVGMDKMQNNEVGASLKSWWHRLAGSDHFLHLQHLWHDMLGEGENKEIYCIP